MKPFRVLHAPASVGGHPQGLSRALRMLGVHSETWIFQQNYLQYHVDRVVWHGDEGILLRETKRLGALLRALRSFDIIHYNFGSCWASSFPADSAGGEVMWRWRRILHRKYLNALNCLELLLLRILGKPLFVVYQGDDARQGDVCRERFAISMATQVPADYYTPASDEFKRQMIRRLARRCAVVYALNPDLLHVLPPNARFQAYAHVFPSEWEPAYTQGDINRPLRIGHAPTHRAAKGTEALLKAIKRLRSRGTALELVLIEGLPHSEARRVYASVDVFVDQLYAGWYGGVAVEAMALGKPVVAYLRDEDLRFVPSDMVRDLPVVRASADDIECVLRRLVEMPRSELLTLARRSRRFVERWHDPIRIATDQLEDYEQALRGGRSR